MGKQRKTQEQQVTEYYKSSKERIYATEMYPYYSLIDFNIILLAFAKKTVEFSILMMAGRELQCFSGEYSNDCSVFGLLRYSLPEDIPLVFLSFSSESAVACGGDM